MTDFTDFRRTSDSEYIVCPFCGEKHGDCWEWVKEHPAEKTCDGCGKTIIVHAEYDVTYIATKPDYENAERLRAILDQQ